MENSVWQQVLGILNDSSIVGYLATVDDGKPKVRPFGFMFEENGRLYFCTSSIKDVYKQITKVPYIEYSKTTKEMVWTRVSGEIKFDDDITKKERLFEQIPELKIPLYGSNSSFCENFPGFSCMFQVFFDVFSVCCRS